MKIISLGLCAVFLSACLGNVQTDGDWEEGVAHEGTYKRVIILGLSPDASARCDFEQYLRTQVRSEATDAQASCLLMKTTDEITRESIDKIIADYNADAVLATVLVASDAEAEEGGDRETRGGIYFKAQGAGYAEPYYRGGYGVWGVPVVYGEWRMAPVLTTLEGEVTIRTMLFATRDESMVYEVLTKAEDLQSRDQGLSEITPEIAEEFRDAGLIR